MRIHTGDRPHECELCIDTFIQSGQLAIHMRTHTNEKPRVCTTCGKGFTGSKQLVVHNRTHTQEKPYSCEICGKSFGYNHVLEPDSLFTFSIVLSSAALLLSLSPSNMPMSFRQGFSMEFLFSSSFCNLCLSPSFPLGDCFEQSNQQHFHFPPLHLLSWQYNALIISSMLI